MTPTEINIAIAEKCNILKAGQRWILPSNWSSHTLRSKPTGLILFTESLDAMHEAEKCIPEHKRGFYNAELSKLASNRNLSAAIKEPEFIYQLLHATSQQRAKAFCRVTGIWKE